MEDESILTKNQSYMISVGLQNFINAMVEEILLEGRAFDTQKKYLKKFSENEGLDYEALEKGITELIETLGEMKTSDSKSLLKLALIQAKEAYVSDAVVFSIAQKKGKNEDKNEALCGIIQSLQNRSAKVKLDDSTIDFNVNGVEFKMVKVEGGSFWMGADNGKRTRLVTERGLFRNKEKLEEYVDTNVRNYDSDAFSSDERPVHNVTLNDYYIGETQVTKALFRALMGAEESVNNPKNFMSWEKCQEFIRKLNSLTGRTFRLPTEAEWEYAARGGKKSRGFKYAGSNNLNDVAWSYDGGTKPKPVKTKKSNELGLYDMSGNVWEWCHDWYDSYSSDSQTNPTGPSSGYRRVLRGGSWESFAGDCRVSKRHGYDPSYGTNYSDFRLFGFRLALSV